MARSRPGTLLPALTWLPGYPRAWLSDDLVAGAIAAAVVLPQAMAYAAIAGLPVQAGLYTAFVPMLVYVFFGTSRPLSVSTTSTVAILTGGQLAVVVPGGDLARAMEVAATLAFLVGIFLLAAALLRLGLIANYISLPVLVGFKAGIGLVILVDQLGKVLGVSLPKGPFFQTVAALIQSLPQTHLPTLLTALFTLVILLIVPHVAPRAPTPLLAVGATIVLAWVLDLSDLGVAAVGEIPPGLPIFVLPDLGLVGLLWPGAIGIALMVFVESIASAQAFQASDEPDPQADQELVALGLANLAGSFFQALPAGGGTSQTAVNREAGARSQMAGLATAGLVALTLLFLGPVLSIMPMAALGALVLVAAAHLISLDDFRAIARIRTIELVWAILALAGVILLGTLKGILVTVLVSVLTLIYAANHPPVYLLGRKPSTQVFRPLSSDHPEDETFPGLMLVRTEGRMHFASMPDTGAKIWALVEADPPRVLVLDCSAIPDIEYTALQRLVRFEGRLQSRGIVLWLAGLNPVPLALVERAPIGRILGHERMFFNVKQAVQAYGAMTAADRTDEPPVDEPPVDEPTKDDMHHE